jgi:hypothetical protein
MNDKKFVQKPGGPRLYIWSPKGYDPTIGKNIGKGGNLTNFCTALAGTYGEDYIVKYVYDKEFVNNKEIRLAYVECGYVE